MHESGACSIVHGASLGSRTVGRAGRSFLHPGGKKLQFPLIGGASASQRVVALRQPRLASVVLDVTGNHGCNPQRTVGAGTERHVWRFLGDQPLSNYCTSRQIAALQCSAIPALTYLLAWPMRFRKS